MLLSGAALVYSFEKTPYILCAKHLCKKIPASVSEAGRKETRGGGQAAAPVLGLAGTLSGCVITEDSCEEESCEAASGVVTDAPFRGVSLRI